MKNNIVTGLQKNKTPCHIPIHESDCIYIPPRLKSWMMVLLFCLCFCLCSLVLTPVSAAENTTITCGVILPLSGDDEKLGTDLLQGIEIAAEEIEKSSNETGYTITLRIADDEGDPGKALALFKEMQVEGIPVVIGSYTTTLTLPMAQETLASHNTILISPQANGEELYGISPRFYQINPPIFSLSEFISEWLKYSSDRTAVIYVDDAYGRSVLNHIRDGLSQYSIPLSGAFPIVREDTDYATLSQNVLNSAPDAIVIIVYDARQIPVISNLSAAGFRGQGILTESSLMDTLEEELSEELSTFPLFTISSYTNLVPGDQSDAFVSAYQTRFNQDPTRTLAGYGYDSLMVVADALRTTKTNNGTITAEMIQKGLDTSRYYGITGPKNFDSHHAAGTAMDRWGFRDGAFELMTISLI